MLCSQLAESQDKLAKMERQNSSLNGRLFSLLKKMESETHPSVPIAEKVLDKPNSTSSSNEQTQIAKVKKYQILNKLTKEVFCVFESLIL